MNNEEESYGEGLRKPPHVWEAECSVLGSLLLDNNGIDRLNAELKPEHFYRPENRLVFAELQAQLHSKKSCDVITIFEALRATSQPVGIEYLNSLAQYVSSAANMNRYAELVIEAAMKRSLIAGLDEISTMTFAPQADVYACVDKAQSVLSGIAASKQDDEWVGAYEGLVAHTSTLEQRLEGGVTYLPTGLSALDDYMDGGLSRGEVMIIGARPSQGKTALGMSIGLSMAATYSVGFLSMEMSHLQVRDRKTAMLGDVSLSQVKRPEKNLDFARVVDAVNLAKNLNFYVQDQGSLNIHQVRSKARALKRKCGLDVLVVDYIGLMAGLDPKQNRNTQLEQISNGLKALAKELDIAVIVLAQLNRKIDERADSMPQLSDLRDSGAIEQDADVIVFVKRPIQSNPELGDEWKEYAKLSVAKNRQGSTGYLNLRYIGSRTKFIDWYGEIPQSMNSKTRPKGIA
jgi:replicative DNA helicase